MTQFICILVLAQSQCANAELMCKCIVNVQMCECANVQMVAFVR